MSWWNDTSLSRLIPRKSFKSHSWHEGVLFTGSALNLGPKASTEIASCSYIGPYNLRFRDNLILWDGLTEERQSWNVTHRFVVSMIQLDSAEDSRQKDTQRPATDNYDISVIKRRIFFAPRSTSSGRKYCFFNFGRRCLKVNFTESRPSVECSVSVISSKLRWITKDQTVVFLRWSLRL